MTAPTLLLSILLAFAVFGALLNSIAQLLAMDTAGKRWLRGAHAACVVGVLIVMAALWAASESGSLLGLSPIVVATLGGGVLAIAAVAAILLETGWRRLSPLPLAVLGGLAAIGAPFSSA